MLYFTLLAILLLWLLIIKVKEKLSWHTIVNVWFISLTLTDITDIILSRFLGLYSLNMQLFQQVSTDTKYGILISDAMIVPLMAVIFTFYYSRYKKWWMPVILPCVMVLIEAVFVYFKYFEYNRFDPLYTATLYVIGAVLLSSYAERFNYYSPPISYRVVLFFAAYVIMGVLGAILGSGLELFLWRPGVFKDPAADDWLLAIIVHAVLGLIICIGLSRLDRMWQRAAVVIGAGLLVIIFSLIMYSTGNLIYNKWNNALNVLKYSVSALAVLLYDRWERKYRKLKLSRTI